MSIDTRRPAWLWMNLLSLDAPVVALVWQDYVARCSGTTLLAAGRCVLALTVWAIYIADRLLERDLRLHGFYREHRRIWVAALTGVVIADLLMTLLWLRPMVFMRGLAVAAASVLYLAVFTGVGREWVLWKKSVAAVLFSSGVFVVASANTVGPTMALAWPWAAFVVLCGGNLFVIDRWKWVWIAMLLFAFVCGALGQTRWYFAIATSAIGLAGIAYWDGRVSAEARRVLADVALFTPLLWR